MHNTRLNRRRTRSGTPFDKLPEHVTNTITSANYEVKRHLVIDVESRKVNGTWLAHSIHANVMKLTPTKSTLELVGGKTYLLMDVIEKDKTQSRALNVVDELLTSSPTTVINRITTSQLEPMIKDFMKKYNVKSITSFGLFSDIKTMNTTLSWMNVPEMDLSMYETTCLHRLISDRCPHYKYHLWQWCSLNDVKSPKSNSHRRHKPLTLESHAAFAYSEPYFVQGHTSRDDIIILNDVINNVISYETLSPFRDSYFPSKMGTNQNDWKIYYSSSSTQTA
jgi:hypothetical protein